MARHVAVRPESACVRASYRFNAIPIRVPMALSFFFAENRKTIVKFLWKHQRPCIGKAVLRKKNGARGITFSDFKLYCKAIVIKTYGIVMKIDT